MRRRGDSRSPGDLVPGFCLAGSILLLILVPILQPSNVGQWKLITLVAIGAMFAWTAVARFLIYPAGIGSTRAAAPAVMLIGTYAVVAAVTTFQAPDTDGPRQVIQHVGIIAVIVVMAWMCSDRSRFVVVRTIVIAAALESIYAIFEATTDPGALWGYANRTPQGLPIAFDSQIFDNTIRGQGTLGHPLVLAFVAVVAIGLTIGFRPLLGRRSFDLVVIVALLGGVLAAGSRSGLLISLALLLFSARKALNRVFFGVCGFVLLLIALTLGGFWQAPVVVRFFQSDSLSHRSSSVSSFGQLLTDQDVTRVLFGNGFWSTVRLYETNVLPNAGNFFAVDNQFVSSLACVGTVGLLALVAAFVWSFWRGTSAVRWGLVAAIGMWWTFDVNVWPPSAAIMVALLVLAAPLRSAPEKPRSPA